MRFTKTYTPQPVEIEGEDAWQPELLDYMAKDGITPEQLTAEFEAIEALVAQVPDSINFYSLPSFFERILDTYGVSMQHRIRMLMSLLASGGVQIQMMSAALGPDGDIECGCPDCTAEREAALAEAEGDPEKAKEIAKALALRRVTEASSH
jgi:hypothetical protein